jgi:hypothetical protein
MNPKVAHPKQKAFPRTIQRKIVRTLTYFIFAHLQWWGALAVGYRKEASTLPKLPIITTLATATARMVGLGKFTEDQPTVGAATIPIPLVTTNKDPYNTIKRSMSAKVFLPPVLFSYPMGHGQ